MTTAYHPDSLKYRPVAGVTWRDVGEPVAIYWSHTLRWLVQAQASDDEGGAAYVRTQALADKGVSAAEVDAECFAQALLQVLGEQVSEADLAHLVEVFTLLRSGAAAPGMPELALPAGMPAGLNWRDRAGVFELPRTARQRWMVRVQRSDAPLGSECARIERLAQAGVDASDLDSLCFAIAWARLLTEELTPRNLKHLLRHFEHALGAARSSD